MDISINYWATLVAAISFMGLGALWYSPVLFGKIWMKAIGMSEAELKEASQGMGMAYGLMFVSALVMSYVLGHMVDYSQSVNSVLGAKTGFWIWLGFVAPVTLQSKVFENKPWTLWLLNNGYNLTGLIIMGIILSVWM